MVADGGGCGVDRVGGQVGAAVEHEDQAEGLGEEEALGAEEESLEGELEGGFERVSTRGIFHDGSIIDRGISSSEVNGGRGLTHLSIIVIIGAADAAAEAALTASTPILRPRFLVFHFRGSATAGSAFAGRKLVELGSTADVGGFTLGNSLGMSRSLASRKEVW